MYCKTIFFLVIDTTIKSDSSLRLRKNLLEKIGKLIMTTDGKIRDEQLHYDINREPAKISSLSSWKIDKQEYLTGEEILPSDLNRIIEQAKFTYSPLTNAFEKETKKIEEQGQNQFYN